MDVLESQFSLLLGNITSTLDFESIKLSHEHFVATLQGQLFLSMPSARAHGGDVGVCMCMSIMHCACVCVYACVLCICACVCACVYVLCVCMCCVCGWVGYPPLPAPQVFSCLCDILDACTTFCAILHATDLTFTPRDRDQINLLAKVRAVVSVDFH